MKNANAEVIYVGKAKNLKYRVQSYFSHKQQSLKTYVLMEYVCDVECIVTQTELEALILENTLIKQHKPKYNVLLKDDKSYPFIKVTVDEAYPQVFQTRALKDDGAKYFGPYASGRVVQRILGAVHALFPLRSCDFELPSSKPLEVCLDYHIQRCKGCCINAITPEEYQQYVDQALLFLSGKYSKLLKYLTTQMTHASDKLHFEAAAKIRDQILAVQKLNEKQKVYSTQDIDVDILGHIHKDSVIICVLLCVREGKLLDKRDFVFHEKEYIHEFHAKTIVPAFLKEFYSHAHRQLPSLILLDCDVPDTALLESFFKELRKTSVRICLAKPQHQDWIHLARTNAQASYFKALKLTQKEHALLQLKELLNLKKDLRRIEAFDISNTLGEQSVAAMVSFFQAQADKKNYRRYKIRSVQGPNDTASIQEVVARRYQRLKNDSLPLPDLILVDGGKGQVNAAYKVLQTLTLEITVLGLAKKNEELFMPNCSKPIILDKGSQALKLLQQVRDEAHRFANQFHKKLRTKDMLESTLEKIPGVGVVRYKALLTHFKSIDALKQASLSELLKVKTLNKTSAMQVYQFFHATDS